MKRLILFAEPALAGRIYGTRLLLTVSQLLLSINLGCKQMASALARKTKT
jgi:hypothetical protein